MPTRPYVFHALTNSLCARCYRKLEAKIVFRSGEVLLLKHCPEHGHQEVRLADDIAYYRSIQDHLKPGDLPLRFQTPIRDGCPFDCGLCPDHEQHGCVTVLEISDACNLDCPICYADSGSGPADGAGRPRRHRDLATIERMLDAIVASEGEPQVVQISGGEPTVHPEFFAVIDLARARPIRHLMVNTNGVRLAGDPGFAERLAAYGPGLEIYLQFDSLEAEPLVRLRGADLRAVRRRALERLNALNLSTTLVVTLARGVNDHEIGALLRFALQQPCVRGVTFQPIQATGRLEGYDASQRYTLTEVRRSILEQSDLFRPEDILPVPCHPDALAMAYALKLDGRVIPLTGLLERGELVAALPNAISFEQDPALQRHLFELFSTGHSPASAAAALGQLLCCLPKLPVPAGLDYRNVFRVLIVQFMDAHNFDVRSVKRSCIHIADPDGRLIPFETYNLFYRPGAPGAAALARVRGHA